MTLATTEALRKVAYAQLTVARSISGTLGRDVANEMTVACQDLLKALDEAPIEEKSTSIFGERVFKTKAKRKKS